MTSDKKTSFHKKAKEKGWDLQDIAKRWGISIRQMSRVANSPKQKDLDAVNGLPKPNKSRGQEK
jgi:hypothetical protein